MEKWRKGGCWKTGKEERRREGGKQRSSGRLRRRAEAGTGEGKGKLGRGRTGRGGGRKKRWEERKKAAKASRIVAKALDGQRYPLPLCECMCGRGG